MTALLTKPLATALAALPALPPSVAKAVARLGARLPQQPPALALSMALNLGLGRLVTPDTVAPLEGKRFLIRVTDLGLNLYFAYEGGRFHPLQAATPVDLTLGAASRDLLTLLLREEDYDTLFFNRRLAMEGDTELGLLVKNTLDGIDVAQLVPAPLRRLKTQLESRFSSRTA